LNSNNSSPSVFNRILCKTIKIDLRNSPKMKFGFLKLKLGMLDWDCVRIQ
jgi:hypothetical protein